MKKIFLLLLCISSLGVFAQNDTIVKEPSFGVVTLSVATMRTEPRYGAEMATQALLGMPVKILQEGRWLQIETPDGYKGFTVSGNVVKMDKDKFNDWTTADKIIFTANNGYAYAAPKEGAIVSDLVAGSLLKLEGKKRKYYKVSYPDGRIAYVLKKQACKFDKWYNSINLTGDNIAKYAHRFMGLPYLWGGTSAKALDCSGFAKTVYFMHGIILQRDASQQCHYGKQIDLSNGCDSLQVGDLMFFGKRADNEHKERVRHVGIYLGDSTFIHEATQVKVGSLKPTAPNYDEGNATEFIRAARVIGYIDNIGIIKIKDNPFYQKQQ